MATIATIAISREFDLDFVKYIEHKTGKRVRTVSGDPQYCGKRILFTDNTELLVRDGCDIGAELDIKPVESFCASCGGPPHSSLMDKYGRCSTSARIFWENVRKLYWHRYLKEK